MIDPLATFAKIGSRTQASKGLKIVDAMGLVVIPAGQRDVGPLDLLLPLDAV